MNSYYIWMLLSALVCTALYAVSARKLGRGVPLALTTLALGAVQFKREPIIPV